MDLLIYAISGSLSYCSTSSDTRSFESPLPFFAASFITKGSLYELYGNNEPYTEPQLKCHRSDAKAGDSFFQLMTGPSTNFYVGPDETHYTIPKRLLYQFSAFAKPCLEGKFAEAEANAVWLPDVSPAVFQWVWKWLYQDQLQVEKYCYKLRDDQEEYWSIKWEPELCQQACQLLFRVHILAERLLLDTRFLMTVQAELMTLIRRAKEKEYFNPFTPQIVHEVLSQSAPVLYYPRGPCISLRSFLLKQLCEYEICVQMDFMKCGRSFELDGAFAADLMNYMARQLEWAVELWGAQTESIVDITEKKLELAEKEGDFQTMVEQPKRRSYVWLALRYICTYQGCTTTPFEVYSKCFELDGVFAAEILEYLAGELRWVREKWGEERGPRVNVAQEKENEEWNDNDYDDIVRLVNVNRYR